MMLLIWVPYWFNDFKPKIGTKGKCKARGSRKKSNDYSEKLQNKLEPIVVAYQMQTWILIM